MIKKPTKHKHRKEKVSFVGPNIRIFLLVKYGNGEEFLEVNQRCRSLVLDFQVPGGVRLDGGDRVERNGLRFGRRGDRWWKDVICVPKDPRVRGKSWIMFKCRKFLFQFTLVPRPTQLSKEL